MMKTRLQTISPGLLTPLIVPPPRREVHGRLALADGAGVAADEVRRRHRAGDLEDPDEVVAVGVAPAHVVQRGGRVEAHGRPDAVGDERVHAGALVDLVEVRQRPARRRAPRAVLGVDRRTVDVVEQPLGQVGRGHQVLEALLVLDADGGAAEVVGDAQRPRCTSCSCSRTWASVSSVSSSVPTGSACRAPAASRRRPAPRRP